MERQKQNKGCKVIALCNQKGGVGKTTTTVSLGAGLARQGNKVLLIDNDSQASLTISLGIKKPDELGVTLPVLLQDVMQFNKFSNDKGIIHHEEGMDLMPADITLATIEQTMNIQMNRDSILKQYVEQVKTDYDYILIDCSPTLGTLTINALTASDSVIIPTQPQFLSTKGLDALVSTITQVKRCLNQDLTIDGILMTMVDVRRNADKETGNLLYKKYNGFINVFSTFIPSSVRAVEASNSGSSIFSYEPKGKLANGYAELVKEVVDNAKEKTNIRTR